jgi:hypothetical protein
MKKIVASVGLVALGAVGLKAATVPGFTPDAPKPWTLSLALRGFYDDNVNSAPSGSGKVDSFGFEVDPSVGFNWSSQEQTTLSLNYMYGFKWYDKQPPGNADHYDQNHTFSLLFSHNFSERYKISVGDSFVIGQEPDFLRAGNLYNTYQRIPGNNVRNYGQITFDAQMSRTFGLQLGYGNAFYDYKDAGAIVLTDINGMPIGVGQPISGGGFSLGPSRSGTLDRIEHTIHLDGRWQMAPDTVGVLGYQYGQTDYTGNEPIGVDALGNVYFSRVRNSRSHYGYLGFDHTFRPDLTGSLRAGARYIDFYNDATSNSDVSPYVMATVRYNYLPQSYVEAGFSYDRVATDEFTVASNGSITTDTDAAGFWVTLNHAITPKLIGSIIGQIQDSMYNGGTLNNKTELYYLLGLNLEYRFNPHFSTSVGYNFDKLDSDIGRSFDRNRVYLGLTASY